MEYKEMNSIVEAVNAIFRRAYWYYFDSLPENLKDFVGFHPYFKEEFPYDDYFIGRYDIMIDEQWTLKFLETNANTPGMICESYHPARILTPEGHTNQNENVVEYTKSWWQERKNKYGWSKIAIFTAYSHENEDYFVCRTYMAILLEVFWEENIFVGDIYDMNIVEDSYVTFRGEKIDALLSYFPLEFFLTDIDFAEKFFSIISDWKCFLANPLESMIPQDKLIFAVVWENLYRYSPSEQDTIRKHIPFTSREFQEDEMKYLAKWRFWRYGREIYTESFYTNIDDASRYIYQKKIIPKKVDDKWSYIVLSAYTNFQQSISWISRKQEFRTTDDTYNGVTLLYTSSL
jgi:glutathionylspermidine synthase